MIISRTPFRISFFGGGTDYPVWYREHGGAVLSTTIDKYCYIMVRELPAFFPFKYRIAYSKVEQTNSIEEIEHPAIRAVLHEMNITEGLEIHIAADLPARSGIGSSSTFVVGLINAIHALKNISISRHDLAAKASYIEQNILHEYVGNQDQSAAAHGGLNIINFKKDGAIEVNKIILSEERKVNLEKHLLLVFTGIVRNSSDVAKTQISNLKSIESELKQIKSLVNESYEILNSSQCISEFGKLLHKTWCEKRKLSPIVSNDLIDKIYSDALSAGAIGGKLLGAGSGGFMLLFAGPEKHKEIKNVLKTLTFIPLKLEDSGSIII
jgi:D-glycero-alpha-D-manno-heptose-7-phosphate kinase